MADTTIDRMPGDCDFDINEVCKDIALNNSLGNLLSEWNIETDKIILTYK